MTDAHYTIAIVGAGVIGRSWALAFARAGHVVRLYDIDAGRARDAVAWVDWQLAERGSGGPLSSHVQLAETLDGVDYVQECGPDGLSIKQAIFRELDALAPPGAILASSQSDYDTNAIAVGLRGAERCLTAHPVNPPHIIPIVEVLPTTAVPGDTIERACAVLRSAGQTPVVMRRFVPGLLMNRLQAAIMREALQLVLEGVADVASVDAAVSEGLGLRWALLGPLAVADANADGGVREYFTKYRDSWIELMDDLSPTPSLEPEQIERIGRGVDQARGGATPEAIREWRNRALEGLLALKRADPAPSTPKATG